jgi:hypothetical protein
MMMPMRVKVGHNVLNNNGLIIEDIGRMSEGSKSIQKMV